MLCTLAVIMACDNDDDKKTYCITCDDDQSVIVVSSMHQAPTPTPEPCSMALLGTGLVATGLYFRKRKK